MSLRAKRHSGNASGAMKRDRPAASTKSRPRSDFLAEGRRAPWGAFAFVFYLSPAAAALGRCVQLGLQYSQAGLAPTNPYRTFLILARRLRSSLPAGSCSHVARRRLSDLTLQTPRRRPGCDRAHRRMTCANRRSVYDTGGFSLASDFGGCSASRQAGRVPFRRRTPVPGIAHDRGLR
jgi:hypothetical protein